MTKMIFSALMGCMLLVAGAQARPAEIHVAVNGNDGAAGSRAEPLRTIQKAAERAQAGDAIIVHEGTYRERINPPRGGESNDKRIVYEAAAGEKVVIKGSEPVKGWVKGEGDAWKVTVPNTLFGSFNPYSDKIHGDWFDPKGREHHTGAVYLNGEWLAEAAKQEEVFAPQGKTALWFGQVDKDNTTIWAQFKGVDPNEQVVEINVRRTVFYPDQPGRNFITVRGFTMRDAATPWAPPTAEQIGLIGTHWSKGWIIENNIVSHSMCSGISLGKHGDEFDNTSADTAEGYVKTIERGLARGWDRENIGHHIVRNNTISHCEQAGIVGSLGAAFSTVTGNTIHDIHVRRLFTGAEMAGIKFHAAIDSVIANNHIYNNCLGLWLDWMAQGTRVSRNVFHDNSYEDLFVEVNHGPFMVDNNLLLSPVSVLDMSEGGAYAHNLFGGRISTHPELGRQTPWHPAHSTKVAGLVKILGGDDRFYNNIFVGPGRPAGERAPTTQEAQRAAQFGLKAYDPREFGLQTGGNVFYNGAQPYGKEKDGTVVDTNPGVKLVREGDAWVLRMTVGPELKQAKTIPVATEMLGKARISGVAYEQADGSPLVIGVDFFGEKRSETPTPGPFERPGTGEVTIKLR